MAKKYNCNVIYLNQNLFRRTKGVKYRIGVGPEEFLWYIKNAKLVVTNSFHGTSLSIIFQKNFYCDIMWHGKENSRVKNILNIAGLENRTIQRVAEGELNVENYIEWESVEKEIDSMRIESLIFLKKSLSKRKA